MKQERGLVAFFNVGLWHLDLNHATSMHGLAYQAACNPHVTSTIPQTRLAELVPWALLCTNCWTKEGEKDYD